MSIEKNNSKANGQALRDKLNQTLKQRLVKKTEAANTLAGPQPAVGPAEPPPRELHALGKPVSRDRQFLDELESDAMHEVAPMDHTNIFSPSGPGAPAPSPQPAMAQWPPQASTPSPLRTPPEPRRAQPDAERPFDMPQPDDTQILEAQPSLMDLLKTSKPEGRTGSSLRSPRQSTQNSAPPPAPEPDDAPMAAPVKNSFLKFPQRNKSEPPPSPESGPAPHRPPAPNHEQEIVEAIKRGDEPWIARNARFSNISPGRQEILLVFAFSKPGCLLALLGAGLRFEPKDGLAIRTALGRKDYAALEALQASGAIIDPGALGAIASWRSNAHNDGDKPPQPGLPAPAPSPESIQAEFDDFLRLHADEIEPDGLGPGTIPEPPSVPTPSAPARPGPAWEARALAPPKAAADQKNDLGGLSFQEAFDEMQQTLRLLDDDPTTPESAPPPAAARHDAAPPALPASAPRRDWPADTDTAPPPVLTPPAERPTAPENPDMTQPPAHEPRKSTPPAPALSAMDRARLSMLDKVLQDKQQLELRVMELQMFEEAAASLDEERNRLIEDLASSHNHNELLSAELALSREDFAAFGSLKAHLELELDGHKILLADQEQASRHEHDRLAQAEANLSSLLKDHERREAELRSHNAQLVLTIGELENRAVPAPEAADWLRDTEKESALRKNMFIDTVLKGEHKLLDKVAKNTAVDRETAQWALVFAAEAGQTRCAQWLVDNLDAHPGFGGELALLRALERKNHDMVRWLANHGADIHHAEEFALRRAVEHDDVPLLDLLISMGANPRAARERPLREAAENQSWRCFRALLGHGCSGHDEKGSPHPEVAEQMDEARPHLEWAAQQRKLARALDPEFAKRQARREH